LLPKTPKPLQSDKKIAQLINVKTIFSIAIQLYVRLHV